MPTRIKDLDPCEGDYVVEVAGGEHHSIARTKDGLVYCWGRNDEGQVGCGDTYGDYRKRKAAEDLLKAMKAEQEAALAKLKEEAAAKAKADAEAAEAQKAAAAETIPAAEASTEPA
jgi:hypothetical protein